MGQIKTIKIDLRDEKSIISAEREKAKLENQGYTFLADDIGFLTATLFYKKERKGGRRK